MLRGILLSCQNTDDGEVLSTWLDAIECIAPKLLYDRALNGLAGWNPSWEDGCSNWGSSSGDHYNDNFDGFVHGLQALYEEKAKADPVKNGKDQEKKFVLVFENAERLKDHIPALITPLARVCDLARIPICVIFLSRLSWDDVRPTIGSSISPYIMDMLALATADLIQQLTTKFEDSCDDTYVNAFHSILSGLYHSFLELLFGTCSLYTQDPSEIAYLASAQWTQYIAPILNDWNAALDNDEEYEIPFQAPVRLNTLFRHSVGSAFEALYTRKMHAAQWIELNTPSKTLRFSQIDRETVVTCEVVEEERQELPLGLPALAKYLLVASFLASYNPARSDTRILSAFRDSNKKLRRGTRKAKPGVTQKLPQSLAGPSAFTFDRLWAVCGALMTSFGSNEKQQLRLLDSPNASEEKELTRVVTLAQISELVQRRLMIRTTVQEKIDNVVVYKCNITLEQAGKVAEELGFPLGSLLWEQHED